MTSKDAQDFHAHMAEIYTRQKDLAQDKEKLKEKNGGVVPDDFYNSYSVSAKLEPKLWRKFWSWCVEHRKSRNSAVKELLSTHPELNKND